MITTTSKSRKNYRAGISLLEVLILLCLTGLVTALAFPWIVQIRELARRSRCQQKLGQLGIALHNYHEFHNCFPPAAVWLTNKTESLALHMSKRFDVYTGPNWVQFLLPYVDQQELTQKMNHGLLVADTENEGLRTRSLPQLNCPSDSYNRADNHYYYESVDGRSIEFARGNYAINAGSNCYKTEPGSTTTPYGDPANLDIDKDQRKFHYWGNGIAGFNVSFSFDDIENGLSTLVAIEEVRAGIHPLDLRGTWALGQIGASATWGHGINGDAYGPNNSWARSDDIAGCRQLHHIVGADFLARENMPCVPYIDVNQNATARSQHSGGVNLTFLDGSVKFISNSIDPSLWHVLHSRETPKNVFPKNVSKLIRWEGDEKHAPPPQSSKKPLMKDDFSNSLYMKFVRIPAGEFEMGIPDQGNNVNAPDETPPHQVRITHDYYLGSTEVTRSQFDLIMTTDSDQPSIDHDFPVVDVSWDKAIEFCIKLSQIPAEKLAGRSYRLPTEAEWEFAARERQSKPHWWSHIRAEDDKSGISAGIDPPLPLTTVASYPPNSLGLYDMKGNAWEWCSDWFDRDYYTTSRLENPAGPQHGYMKVVRGSDWIYVGEPCFINYPILPPWKSSPFIGFRVVCVQIEPSESEGE